MASPVGHTLVGVGLAAATAQVLGTPASGELWLGAAAASNIPDLDWLALLFGRSGLRLHRHGSHSLLVVGGLIALGWAWGLASGGVDTGVAIAWSVALLSHPVLDLITTSPGAAARGFGIPLFWPMASRRWAVPRPVFRTAPYKQYRSMGEVWQALLPELGAFGPPTVLMVAVHLLLSGHQGLPPFPEIGVWFHRLPGQ